MDQTFIDSYSCYDSYKDSGVDWLGEIPEEWNLTPAFKFINENKLKNKGLTVDTVLSLSYGNILIKPKEKLTGLVPESFETYQIVEPNDIIIRCMDLQNDKTSLRIGLVKDKGIITSAYLALKVANSYLPEYLYYYLHSLDTSKAIYKMGTGLRQNLSFGDFKRFQVPNIPLKVQQSIVDFVKTKSTQIDQAITLKQQQIAKLEEYKQIVIQNAVTKGLNPDAPMKDSGVDWIGDIPEHWVLKRLKYILSERNERSKNGEEPLFMMSQKHGLVVRSEYHEKAEVALSNIDNKIVYKNDLVFNKLKAHLGVFFKSNINYRGLVSPDYAVYKCKAYIDDVKFLETLFRNPEYIKQFIIRATGIVEGLIRLYTSELFDLHVAVPPPKEQKEILSYIEAQSSKIDTAVNIIQQEINRLKEYKTILINQTVTGKIKVS